jgi:hypothetical protein
MKGLLGALLAILLFILCAACGNVFFSASSQPGFSTTSGLVSTVQVSTVIGTNGTTVQVTFVTFLQEGSSSTVGFCGDQSGRFPMNQTVRTDFISQQSCSTLLVVVII